MWGQLASLVAGKVLPKAAGWLGNKLGGGGGGGGGAGGGGGPGFFGSPGQQQTTGTRLDPATRKKQDDLYNATQGYVATNPYSTTFSGPTSTMSNMSQTGQQFLTNRLMGPGAYKSQNLGFKPWQDTATANWSYPGPSAPSVQPPGQPPGQPPFAPPGQPPFAPPGQPPGVPAAARVEEQNQIQTASTTYDPNTAIADAARVRADGQFRDGGGEGGSDLTPAGRAKLATQGFQPTPAEVKAGVGAGGFMEQYKRDNIAAEKARNAARQSGGGRAGGGGGPAQPQGSISIDGGVDIYGNPLEAPDPNRMAVRGGGGEGESLRDLYMSDTSGQRPPPGFSDEFGGGGDEFGGGPALRIGQPSIGMPQSPGDVSGNRASIQARYGLTEEETTAAIESQGQSLAGRSPTQGLASMADYQPRPGDGRGMQQQPPVPGQPRFSDEFGDGGDEFSPGGIYEGTGGPGLSAPSMGGIVAPDAYDTSAVARQNIPGGQQQQPTGFSDEFGGPGLSLPRPNIDMAAGGPQVGLDAYDPSSPGVRQQQIPGGQQQGPPADGEQFTPASLSAMDTASSAVGDILTADPTARTTVDGASVLNRPEGEGIEAYMNAGGVSSQVEAAQREADRITTARQGRQAQAGAFGSTSSRAALEDIEAGGDEARMIADIRRQGFDAAASRMDADVGRDQQARLAEAEIQSQETEADRNARLRAAQIGTNIGSTIGQEERAIGTSMMDMGKDQEAIANQQRAQEYEQWLRQQEGGAKELSLLNSMMPEGDTERTATGRSGFDKTLSTVGSVGSAALTLAELFGGGGGEPSGEPGLTPEEIENERLKKLLAGGTPRRRTGPRGGGRIVPDAVKLRNQPRFNPSGGGGEF